MRPLRDEDGDSRNRLIAEAGRHLGWGLTWALSTALFLALGWLVDRWLGTVPLFTVIGAFVGAGAGFYSLYRHLSGRPGGGGRRDEKGGR